ncbi:MAG: hypothetical protein ABIH85_00760 [Candidatus Omnitrophota bacterium]
MNPKIGIVASAHRPKYWMSLYESLGKNNIEFELIFVGPNPPHYKLPKNFHFIRSFVKPAQCVEIAVRNTTADFIMDIADDCGFKTSRPLDKLYDFYKSCNSDKVIVSSRMMTNGEDQSHFAHRFHVNENSSFLIPVCGFMSKKFYFSIGGIDKNFIAIMWSLDVAMRVYALGGRVVLSDVYLNEDRSKSMGSNLCGEFWGHDRVLLESLWTTNGKLCLDRKNPVESFSDFNLLSASQGPRGRWRGDGSLFVEKAEDIMMKCKSNFGRISRGIKQPSMYFSYAKRLASRLKKKL